MIKFAITFCTVVILSNSTLASDGMIRALSRHFAAKNIQVVNDELQIKKDCIGEVAPLLKALAESPRPVFATLEGIQKSIWLAEFDRPRRPRIWIN